ncbi:MAG: hypothetical protein HY293_07125 [Planctomycetes bacterium]|nr:hypothetical protein [Planctomycetota bacterium]
MLDRPRPEYSFSSTHQDGYLHVRVFGVNDAATTRRYIEQVLAAASKVECANVLIEENLEGPRLSLTEIFDIVDEWCGDFRLEIRLLAFVDLNPDRSESNLQFAETISVNRGVTVKAFPTAKQAQAWLRERISGGPG